MLWSGEHTSQWSLYSVFSFLMSPMLMRSGRGWEPTSRGGNWGKVWDVSAKTKTAWRRGYREEERDAESSFYQCSAGGVGSVRPLTAPECCCRPESFRTDCQTCCPPSAEAWTCVNIGGEHSVVCWRWRSGKPGKTKSASHASLSLRACSCND